MDAGTALVAKTRFVLTPSKTTTHDLLKTQWKTLFGYDSTPQKPTVKAWCDVEPPKGAGGAAAAAAAAPTTSAGAEGADTVLGGPVKGKVEFEQRTEEGSEVVGVDQQVPTEKLRAPGGSALSLPVKLGAACEVLLVLNGVEVWVDGVVAKVAKSGTATVSWRKVTVTAKYLVSGLPPGEYALRIMDGLGKSVFDEDLEDAVDVAGTVQGQFETPALRLEAYTAAELANVVPKGKDKAPNIVDMRLEVVERMDTAAAAPVVRGDGVVMNTFGLKKVVALMQRLDGYEVGSRRYYENRGMAGPAREELNFSPALTDVELDGAATAQVRATLKAFTKAWGGGKLDTRSLQVCFRILMQATGVRVHQLFELHTTANFERGRDRRCFDSCWCRGNKRSLRRGVAFTPKVAEAMLEPARLSTQESWDAPLKQLQQRRRRRSLLPFWNLASLVLFVLPLVVFLLHGFVFDSRRGIPGRAIFNPLEHHANQSLTCCNDWARGRLVGLQHIGNASHVDSIAACCLACSDTTRAGFLGTCDAAVWDERSEECLFYRGHAAAEAAAAVLSQPRPRTGTTAAAGQPSQWVVVPRGALSRAVDWCVHRVAPPLSLVTVVALWVWTLGPVAWRVRRGRTAPREGGGVGDAGCSQMLLPAPLSWVRAWGIDIWEAMNCCKPTTLYVDEDFVDEALVLLLEEAEERRRFVFSRDTMTFFLLLDGVLLALCGFGAREHRSFVAVVVSRDDDVVVNACFD
jgi:hypothetical protein